MRVASNDAAIESVLKMKTTGASDDDIYSQLSEQGFSPTQISDAINQAQIKSSIGNSDSYTIN